MSRQMADHYVQSAPLSRPPKYPELSAEEDCMSRFFRSSVYGLWAVITLGGTLGCHTLHLNGVVTGKPDRIAKDSPTAQVPAAPGKYTFRLSQFVFLHDFELKQDQALFRELEKLHDRVYSELKLPSSTILVQVYLFEDRDRYERFMRAKYPELPKRRAFFVAQPRNVGTAEDLLVYTYWGERIQEDLRHELTHALLHSVLKDVPLWLDEGLAEYFEVAPNKNGLNQNHLDHLRRDQNGPFPADLPRLEQLSQVQQMTPAEYREAWAWVHLMLHDKPEAKTVLINYLQQLRTNPNPGSLKAQLATVYPSVNEALNKHLAQVDSVQASPRAHGKLRIQ
jgi:hypothetical protein